MIENRQDLPRIELEFPAFVVLENEAIIHLSGMDVSRGGMGLECDRATAEALVLKGSVVSPDAGAAFDVRWELPAPNGGSRRLELIARARLAWSRPGGGGRYRLGLSFLSLGETARERLDWFVAEAMRP